VPCFGLGEHSTGELDEANPVPFSYSYGCKICAASAIEKGNSLLEIENHCPGVSGQQT